MMATIFDWLMANSDLLIGVALILSESAAGICQLLFPQNKGVTGFLASIIKFLQNLKKPSS